MESFQLEQEEVQNRLYLNGLELASREEVDQAFDKLKEWFF